MFKIGDKVRINNNHPVSHGLTGVIDESPLSFSGRKYYEVRLDKSWNAIGDYLCILEDKLELIP